MNQYESRQVPALLKSSKPMAIKESNGMAEFLVEGQRVIVPTAQAFHNLMKRVTVLEQRLVAAENKANRVHRKRTNEKQ